MILKDIEHQIVSEQEYYGSLLLICKDPVTGDLQKYLAVRSSQDRTFWPLVKHGKLIHNKKSQYRKTMDKLYSILGSV